MKNLLYSFLLLLVILPTSAQTKFEGEIKYRNFENHSKAVRWFSKGQAYNGSRNVTVKIKGDLVLISDESMHISTLLRPDLGKVYIYSDVLKRGLACSFKEYTQGRLSTYARESNIGGRRQYEVTPSKKTVKVNGKNCKVYSGKILNFITDKSMCDSNTPVSTIEAEVYTYSQYSITPNYRYYLGGLDVPGIVMKWTIDQKGKVPLIGQLNSYIAAEAKSIIPRKVSLNEMEVPEDYEIKETNSPNKMLGLYGDVKKYLKKQKFLPTDVDKDTNVTYNIEEEWTF